MVHDSLYSVRSGETKQLVKQGPETHATTVGGYMGYSFDEAIDDVSASPGSTRWDGANVTWAGVTWNVSHFNVTIDSGELEPTQLIASIIAAVCLGFIVCMTIGGNVLVLMAVFVNSHLRSTTNYFIVNLAIADLLLGTTVLPFSASLEVINYWAFGQIFCDIWAAVDVLCCTASIMSLCVISIDRYIGVTRPLQHCTIMTEKRALYIIILVWILSMAISVAPLFGWKEPPPDDPSVCEVTQQVGYVLFSVSGSFYIPLAIILVVYFRVYREALNQSRFLTTGIKQAKSTEANHEVTLRIHTGRQPNASKQPHQSSSSSEHSEGSNRKPNSRLTVAGKMAKFKREKKAAKTLGIVVGVFILCWFPFFFLLPLASLCSRCNIPEWLFKIIFWLGYCNSMMNPIIYACSSKDFKRAFARILKCQWRRRPRTFQDDRNTMTTELSKMERFLPFTSLSRRGNNRRDSNDGAANRLLMQDNTTRRRCEKESPIASLRLLHNSNRQITMDTVVSDDESGGHDGDITDDEKSDISLDNDMALQDNDYDHVETSLSDPHHNSKDNRHSYGADSAARGFHGSDQVTTSSKSNARAAKRWDKIPDIVIDDLSDVARGSAMASQKKDTNRKDENPQKNMSALHHGGFYQPSDDNIMWL